MGEVVQPLTSALGRQRQVVLWERGHPYLHRKVQTNQGYIKKKKKKICVRQMAQQLNKHVLEEDQGSTSRTHMVVHNHLLTLVPGDLMLNSDFQWHQEHIWCIYIHGGKTFIHRY